MTAGRIPFFRFFYPVIVKAGLVSFLATMDSISIKTVAALIDHTAQEEGSRVSVKYVTKDGYIREMVISKRKSIPKKKTVPSEPVRKKANVKMNGLIQILDHSHGEAIAKTLFLYGIIGFNPSGNLNQFIPVYERNLD